MIWSRLRLFLTLSLCGLALTVSDSSAQTQAQKKPDAAQQEQEPEYTEEEYDAYEKATKEPDPDKRAAALTAFMDKYPKSKLQTYIVTSYQTLLYEYQQKQNYAKLGPAAEAWLKYFPTDFTAIAFTAEAAQKNGQDKKFIDYGLRVYAAKPTGNLAYFLMETYKKLGDKAKYLEWADKSLPYFPENFALRMEFVEKYTNEKNYAKAAEYARLSLESVKVAKKPDSTPEATWRDAVMKTKRGCHYIIALNHYDQDKCNEAIEALNRTLVIDPRFDWAYYWIGMCQWKLKKLENHEAPRSFAMAELLNGESSSQAKELLEKIYKAVHNNNTSGIEKVYNQAKEALAERARSAANSPE